MSFETYLLWITLIGVAIAMVHALVTGRFGPRYDPATRRDDPVGYALYLALLVVLIAFSIRVAMTGALDEDERLSLSLLYFPPLFLYALIEMLRTGKARVLSREPFRRDERPAPYWTFTGMTLLLLVAFTWGLATSGLLTAS
ncbi:MAG: hypothetical protein QOC65_632 [Sphingomonadales bacterium]|nr:hypothetical protein [Sphingomonadales bacterium]